MNLSVIIRSRDEAPRLRLVLASLATQSVAAEIVVVDDGSADETAEVIAAAPAALVTVRHASAKGRSAASNAGARAASGEILLFLDGDTLAGPGFVAAHIAAHTARAGGVGRGETWHLRCTRFLRDPETGKPWPDQAERLRILPLAELNAMRVTRGQVTEDFDAIMARASPGVYPGAAPRRLHALEMDALRLHPDCALLWAAASGSNLSVSRAAFQAAGGFDEALDINEHRELALRLCEQGHMMMPVEGARTYHMTHRTGWRDPLDERAWRDVFARRHPTAPLALLEAFWSGISDASAPGWIGSLPELAAAAA